MEISATSAAEFRRNIRPMLAASRRICNRIAGVGVLFIAKRRNNAIDQ